MSFYDGHGHDLSPLWRTHKTSPSESVFMWWPDVWKCTDDYITPNRSHVGRVSFSHIRPVDTPRCDVRVRAHALTPNYPRWTRRRLHPLDPNSHSHAALTTLRAALFTSRSTMASKQKTHAHVIRVHAHARSFMQCNVMLPDISRRRGGAVFHSNRLNCSIKHAPAQPKHTHTPERADDERDAHPINRIIIKQFYVSRCHTHTCSSLLFVCVCVSLSIIMLRISSFSDLVRAR